MSNAIEIYQYPKCSTCRRALAWLKAEGVTYRAYDITTSPPSRSELAALVKRSGLPVRKWLNTSGQSYRAAKDRLAKMDDAGILDALAKDGKMIKRPIVVAPNAVLVGFDEERYADIF